jgi:hypothetical protein
MERPTLEAFVQAASEYITACVELSALTLEDGSILEPAARKKAGQIRLSRALAKALAADLRDAYSGIEPVAGETTVSGALRPAKVDVVEMTYQDGLKLSIELKPINLAVGRAIWNRFGDIRINAVSTHLKFPYAVAGGVLTVPTVEWVGSKKEPPGSWKSTEHLILRLVELLRRAGGREREDDAVHRLEAVAVVVFDPHTAKLRHDLPARGSGLRWDEAVAELAHIYQERFPPDEIVEQAAAAEQAEELLEVELEPRDEDEGSEEG